MKIYIKCRKLYYSYFNIHIYFNNCFIISPLLSNKMSIKYFAAETFPLILRFAEERHAYDVVLRIARNNCSLLRWARVTALSSVKEGLAWTRPINDRPPRRFGAAKCDTKVAIKATNE